MLKQERNVTIELVSPAAKKTVLIFNFSMARTISKCFCNDSQTTPHTSNNEGVNNFFHAPINQYFILLTRENWRHRSDRDECSPLTLPTSNLQNNWKCQQAYSARQYYLPPDSNQERLINSNNLPTNGDFSILKHVAPI